MPGTSALSEMTPRADFAGRLDGPAEVQRPAAIREALVTAAGGEDHLDDYDGAVAVAAAALVASQCPGGEDLTSPYGPQRQKARRAW